ncbi:MAG: PHP domain-containing protein [Desulfovibrionaceae bacterium]|jgi:predicted metal-dependent phosphoesterase TrpH|nr:PHP domain-containing protein [Desulfovibrionaceae bacterium]
MFFDLHVHSSLSACSRLPLETILAWAGVRGLDGVCITDHDTMAAAHQVREGVQEDGLVVVVGMEYATADGDFLLFGPFEGLRPGLGAREALEIVRAEGGVAVGAHPFRAGRALSEWVVREGLCTIVERINGRNRDAENVRVESWLRRYPLRACCGSDAHTLEELGRAPTRLLAPVATRDQFIAALLSGSFESCAASAAPAASL